MKRAWIPGLLAALAASGCGGSSTTSKTAVSTSTATSATTSTPASATDCDALGINPVRMREGTCTNNGTTYVIVDENHTLKLHTLSAHLNAVNAETSLGGTSGTVANGKFLVLTLALTNRLTAVQTFDAAGTQQAGLILNRTLYKEDTSAERADLGSCLKHASPPIPAGRTVTCDVVFDVPAAAAADVGKHGSGDIYLVDFGEDLAGNTPPQTVGQIRLYH